MQNKNVTKQLGFIALSIFFLSCNTPTPKSSIEDLKKSIEEIQPTLFKASDVAKIIEDSEAEYLPSVALPTDIIVVYMDGDSLDFLSNEILAAALMGMYTADVSYHLAFLNRDAAFESYTAAQLIANELGFGGEYHDNLLSRHESDTFSIDAMLDVLDNSLSEMNTNYSESDRTRILVGFIAANYIEKQYQIHATIQSYKDKDIDDKLKLQLSKEFVLTALSQQEALNSLIEIIHKNKYAEDKGILLAELLLVRNTFSNLAPLKEKVDVLSPADVFENEDFDAMFNQIAFIRSSLAQTIEN